MTIGLRIRATNTIFLVTYAKVRHEQSRQMTDEYRQDGAGGRHAGADRTHAARQGDRFRRHRGRQPNVSRGGTLAHPHWLAMARPSGALRQGGASSGGSAAGPFRVSSSVLRASCLKSLTSNTFPSMVPSSKPTRRHPAQRGGLPPSVENDAYNPRLMPSFSCGCGARCSNRIVLRAVSQDQSGSVRAASALASAAARASPSPAR